MGRKPKTTFWSNAGFIQVKNEAQDFLFPENYTNKNMHGDSYHGDGEAHGDHDYMM